MYLVAKIHTEILLQRNLRIKDALESRLLSLVEKVVLILEVNLLVNHFDEEAWSSQN